VPENVEFRYQDEFALRRADAAPSFVGEPFLPFGRERAAAHKARSGVVS
jgi:hypothetical protein